MLLAVRKFKISSFEKGEKKGGHRSPSLVVGKLKVPSSEIVERRDKASIAIASNK